MFAPLPTFLIFITSMVRGGEGRGGWRLRQSIIRDSPSGGGAKFISWLAISLSDLIRIKKNKSDLKLVPMKI